MCLKFFILALLPISINAAEIIESKKIVILGGGMAGLTAAYSLGQEGIKTEIFEGRDRLGGRTHTHYFNEDKTCFYEEGGTFIDQGHTEVISLAKKLGVPLKKRGYGSKSLLAIYNNESQDLATLYPLLKNVHIILNTIWKAIKNDDSKLSRFDRDKKFWVSSALSPYLENLPDKERKFIKTFYEDETGNDIESAPAVLLEWMVNKIEGYEKLIKLKSNKLIPNVLINQLGYDQVVEGGISALVERLKEKIEPATTINLNHKLTHIDKEDKHYILSFQVNGSLKTVRTNKIIITLPFSTLRDVQISKSVSLNPLQEKAIQTLSYGTNSKVGFPINSSTNVFDEMLYYINLDRELIGWPGENALTLMISGSEGKNLNQETVQKLKDTHGQVFENNCPTQKNFLEPHSKNWTQDEFSKGSYSTPTTSVDYTLYYSSALHPEMRKFAEPVNNSLFFAGEHTQFDVPGTIEGAVRSGFLAADLVKNSIK